MDETQELSQILDKELNSVFATNPVGDVCRTAINVATQYVATVATGGDMHLKADGQIDLLAAENTVESRRRSSSASGGVGVAITVGSNGVSFGVTANASGARGKGDGKDVSWTDSRLDIESL